MIGDRLLSIVTSTLPDADVGAPYSVFPVRTGGTGPYGWDVLSGSTPAARAPPRPSRSMWSREPQELAKAVTEE